MGPIALAFSYQSTKPTAQPPSNGVTHSYGAAISGHSCQTDINFSLLFLMLHTILSLLYQEAISPICLGR